MLALELFKHYLLSRRAGSTVRTVAWLCIAGVSIGVMALIIVLSVMNGFNSSIQRRLLAVEPHLVVTLKNVDQMSEVESGPIFKMLKSRPELRVDSFESQDVIIRTSEGLYGGAAAHSVNPESLRYIVDQVQIADTARNPPKKGEDLTPKTEPESLELQPGEVILGVDLARSLGIFEGDQIVAISPETLLLPKTEIPILEKVRVKSLISTNIPEIDSKAVYFLRGKSLLHLQNSPSREVGIEVRLPDPENFASLKSEIESLGGTVASWRDRNSSLFYALRLEKIAMGAFLGLSALIASFSIVTVLVLLLTQKRKDIGIFMAMGMSKKATQNLFLQLGLALSSLGLIGGVVIGTVICLIIDHYPLAILPDIYYDSTIPAKVDPVLIVIIFLVAALISFLSAWLPTRKHVSLVPAEALRSRLSERS